MSSHSRWGISPRRNIEAECRRRGKAEVVAGCIALFDGDTRDRRLIVALGGPPAQEMLIGNSRADLLLWTRVWAVRGLLWAWDESARDALRAALDDDAWRVREMAAKVVARNLLGDVLSSCANLRNDPVARVRQAAGRSVARLTLSRA